MKTKTINQEFNIKPKEFSKNKKERSSNIELLRIILAIFVILIHYVGYWYLPFLCGTVNCFTIITGYFLIKNNDNYRFLKFIPTIVFLHVINICLFIFFNYSTSYRIIENKEGWIELIQYGLGAWWYIWAIFILYIISPFLNYGMQTLGKNTSLVLIISLWIVFQLQGLLKYSFAPFGYYWGSFVMMIYAYLLGGYIRLHGAKLLEWKKSIWVITILFLAIQYMFFFLYKEFYPNQILWLDFSNNNQSLFALPTGFLMFISFLTIPLKNYKVINFLASLSLFTFAYHNSSLKFSSYFIYVLNLKNTFLIHRLIALLITFVISFAVWWPFKKYDYAWNIVYKKIEAKNVKSQIQN
ncbi:acyltransferase [Spiroplasma chinense]|uniref:Acyltransferase n=1 Tax=Spiroplasma chinense TaxID=216932 RepID=A0A5B9Y3P2_9MOLU|nr:acyltransferase [Spiroplasma chinense]QEH61778.1 acyltransferase [Spiroplasma chinense]